MDGDGEKKIFIPEGGGLENESKRHGTENTPPSIRPSQRCRTERGGLKLLTGEASGLHHPPSVNLFHSFFCSPTGKMLSHSLRFSSENREVLMG